MNQNTTTCEQIEGLSIELAADGYILLEQDSCGNLARVAVHPIYMRYIAEKMGLVETSDPQAHKTIAMLKRRLLVLNDRIDHLADWLANNSDHKHADLTYELAYAMASADIAREFCADLVDMPVPIAGTVKGAAVAPCAPCAGTAQGKDTLTMTTPQASLI